MSNPTVSTEFAMPDPGANPLNLIQLFQLANTLVSSVINTESFNTYVIQNGTPDVEDQGKVWFELDVNRRPLAIKTFYNGSWRRVYNGMRGEIRGYTGRPTDDFDMTGLNPGRGKTDGIYDGWALCNGKNGTPDFSDNFLIGAHMNNAGGHDGYLADKGGWTTFISNKDSEHTGGVRDFTLDETTTFVKPVADLWVGKWAADGGGRADDGQLYGKPRRTGGESGSIIESDPPNTMIADGADGTTPTSDPPLKSVSVIPPFIALAWITFVGYT